MAKDMLQPEKLKAVETKRLIAQVVSIDDRDRFLRVQVRIQAMHPPDLPDEDLPWAEYALPPGNRANAGTFIHVEPGDYVWVDFPYVGDVRRPRLLGSVHYCPDAVPNFPHEAWNGPDAVEHKRMDWEPMPEDREYCKQDVISHKGIVIEFVDDSVIITQRETGTAIEITPEGDMTLHGEKDVFMSAQKDMRIHAERNIMISAKGMIAISAGLTCSVVGVFGCVMQGGSAGISLGLDGGRCTGNFHFDGNIDADGTILDALGNTPNHSHGDGA